MTDPDAFVARHTAVVSPPLLPELRLHLADEPTALWHATAADLEAADVPPPYWAFAWAGGQALARYVLDHPEVVRGRRVLDLACGGGVVAIAAARAGAASVRAVDIDAFAVAATLRNATLNGVAVEADVADLVGGPAPDADLVLCGDVFYDLAMTGRLLPWLQGLPMPVLAGDPGRNHRPGAGIEEVARYAVPVPPELEGVAEKRASVLRVLPVQARPGERPPPPP